MSDTFLLDARQCQVIRAAHYVLQSDQALVTIPATDGESSTTVAESASRLSYQTMDV